MVSSQSEYIDFWTFLNRLFKLQLDTPDSLQHLPVLLFTQEVYQACYKGKNFIRKRLDSLYLYKKETILAGEVLTIVNAVVNCTHSPLEFLIACVRLAPESDSYYGVTRFGEATSVEISVFRNHRMPREVIIQASEDARKWRRIAAAENHSCPAEVLSDLVRRDRSREVRLAAYMNPYTRRKDVRWAQQRIPYLQEEARSFINDCPTYSRLSVHRAQDEKYNYAATIYDAKESHLSELEVKGKKITKPGDVTVGWSDIFISSYDIRKFNIKNQRMF